MGATEKIDCQRCSPRGIVIFYSMRLTGFLLLLAGWGIVLAALALLAPNGPRAPFILAGVAVEALGLVLVARSHIPRRERG